MPGAHPAAAHDARVARARIRAASLAGDRACRPRLLGFFRQASAPLRPRDRARVAGPCVVWLVHRPVPPAAARLRLDPLSRFPGAARRYVPGAMAPAPRALT